MLVLFNTLETKIAHSSSMVDPRRTDGFIRNHIGGISLDLQG
jgi:hypothetical protein